ncbi:Lrp/AsnC family transcriptional regulator [Phenylobacterium sp.]|jgi:Lrp/AsnC family transcriptional regulator|uniref:Lrp/AsnC family transcriptional regulator n=1 Tax=Phenylobacterium sp. TaxID=1871053 RepID=UPI002FD95EB2
MPFTLDPIDIKILDLMQRDASLSTAELAERVGLSQSPCWRRIQRLREEGYIKAVVAIVDHKKLGFTMQIFAQVKMTTLSEEERENFYKAINNIPEILECWTVFGEMDAMLKIMAPDVAWYQDFIFAVLLKLPGVVDVRSIVTLAESKSTTAVPLRARQFR